MPNKNYIDLLNNNQKLFLKFQKQSKITENKKSGIHWRLPQKSFACFPKDAHAAGKKVDRICFLKIFACSLELGLLPKYSTSHA
jgi:hypothetical protein